MMGSSPLTTMFRELEEAVLSPPKYGRAMVQGGTKDSPVIAEHAVWVVRKYKAWHDEDGGYHEEFIHEDEEDIVNPGGTG
tara:strand:+ start:1261 stop:1500 length:240 start_codon:yes stop_codon:yes gene_type:complete